MAGISIRGLSKSYVGDASLAAVSDLTLDIADNQFVTLLGPSGCGKTTTLRLIAGFMAPDTGTIYADGRLMSSCEQVVPPEERGMGMVFQNYAVWPHKTVFENVVFGLKVRGVAAGEARARVKATLALVNLTGFEDRLPSELSGGQQQRAALARSLVVEPKILLLDEPLSNLDAKLRERMRSELKQLQRRTGITFVYVTHDQAEALALSDRIAVMHGGRLQQFGTPQEVYARPASSRGRGFHGPGEPVAGDGGNRCWRTWTVADSLWLDPRNGPPRRADRGRGCRDRHQAGEYSPETPGCRGACRPERENPRRYLSRQHHGVSCGFGGWHDAARADTSARSVRHRRCRRRAHRRRPVHGIPRAARVHGKQPRKPGSKHMSSEIAGREHWIQKGDVRLFLWNKASAGADSKQGTILFVHGSSMASQPTFDLQVPGRADSSVMEWFAKRGFDTWCVDMEGYGRSDKKRNINFDIANGGDDLAAASAYILDKTGSGPLLVYGISSGALRAAVFAERHPERVKRLALDAFVWTGEGSPTLAERKKKLPEFQAKNRRPIDKAFVYSIFNRDHPGTAEDKVIEAFADAILSLDELGTDWHLCGHVLQAAAGRPRQDRDADHSHARAMGRHRQRR